MLFNLLSDSSENVKMVCGFLCFTLSIENVVILSFKIDRNKLYSTSKVLYVF